MARSSGEWSSRTLAKRERQLERAIRKLAKGYPELEGRLAVTRAQRRSPKRDGFAAAPRCIAWGIDPVTGKRICIRWSD
jgi:hypothetical protein